MKKATRSFTMVIAVIFYAGIASVAHADSANDVVDGRAGVQAGGSSDGLAVTNDVYQGQQMVGGQQYMLFYSKGAKIPRQFIGAYSDPDFVYPPPPVYKDWQAWADVAVISVDMLYPLETARAMIEKFQWTGSARYRKNNDPIGILGRKPTGPNDQPILIVELEGPDGGLLEETIKRALSLGKGFSGGRRAFVEYRKIMRPRSSGFSLGAGAQNSYVLGDATALAFSATPMIGWSETRILEPHKVKTHFYNDGAVKSSAGPMPAENPREPRPMMGEEKLPLILFDTNAAIIKKAEEEKIPQYVSWVKGQWADIVANKHIVLFIGNCDIRGEEGHNDTLGMERAKVAMLEVGSRLLAEGFSERELAEHMRFVSAGKRQPLFAENRKNRHVAMVRAKKITEGRPD